MSETEIWLFRVIVGAILTLMVWLIRMFISNVQQLKNLTHSLQSLVNSVQQQVDHVKELNQGDHNRYEARLTKHGDKIDNHETRITRLEK